MVSPVIKHVRTWSALQEIGSAIGSDLEDGDVVALVGPKGAGKTVIARAIVEALNVRESFAPAPFTMVQQYRTGRMPVRHLDLFYLGGVYEFRSSGMERWLEGKGVTIIEWADRIAGILPPGTIQVELRYGDRPGERTVRIQGSSRLRRSSLTSDA